MKKIIFIVSIFMLINIDFANAVQTSQKINNIKSQKNFVQKVTDIKLRNTITFNNKISNEINNFINGGSYARLGYAMIVAGIIFTILGILISALLVVVGLVMLVFGILLVV